jgi:hypothetical protein
MTVVLIETKIIFSNFHFSSKLAANIFLLGSSFLIGFSIYLLSSIILKNTEVLIFKKKSPVKKKNTPLNLLSPFGFLSAVEKSPDEFKKEYLYKINVYTVSSYWEIENVGVKLIGLFKDITKKDYLMELISNERKNDFLKRNAVNSLDKLKIWDNRISESSIELLHNPYYEIRVSAIKLITNNMPKEEYEKFQKIMKKRIHRVRIEEKLAYIKFMAKFGSREDIDLLKPYFLHSNSLLREEILTLLLKYFRRNILDSQTIKSIIDNILITSNNMRAEFKLKQLIKKIYGEIE